MQHAPENIWAHGGDNVEETKNTACMQDSENKPFDDMGFAKVDLARKARQGVPEVIYGAGKTPEQIAAIANSLLAANQTPVLITRVVASAARAVREILGERARTAFTYHEQARLCVLGAPREKDGRGKIAVVCAGTSDLPVAEEAACVAQALGNEVLRVYDVGVAGIHRLMAQKDLIQSARVVVAVAGMEGALASVLGGMVRVPVLAVPTSVGYGASFGGVAALLSMLNSCSSNVSVVNIDNGFGAAFQASLINHLD